MNRQFHAPRPNALRVSDFTYVATWAGLVYVAFVIDAFARRIVVWRAARSMQAELVLDALELALHARRPAERRLIHHSDRGVQGGLNRSSQHRQFRASSAPRPAPLPASVSPVFRAAAS